MIYALNSVTYQRQEPTPNARAICPTCDQPVTSKCGKTNAWHWAHISSADCDSWSEPETEWHAQWKKRFKQTEVTIARNGKKHRADAQSIQGQVIEFQHSSISAEEIKERNIFYNGAIWVLDCLQAYENDRLVIRRKLNGIIGIRWKQPKRSFLQNGHTALYLHTEADLLVKVQKFFVGEITAGYGQFVTVDDFVRQHA